MGVFVQSMSEETPSLFPELETTGPTFSLTTSSRAGAMSLPGSTTELFRDTLAMSASGGKRTTTSLRSLERQSCLRSTRWGTLL